MVGKYPVLEMRRGFCDSARHCHCGLVFTPWCLRLPFSDVTTHCRLKTSTLHKSNTNH